MENIIKYFILPSNLIVLFLTAGIIFYFKKNFKKVGIYLIVLSALIYVIFGTGPVSFWLLGNLEYQYPYLSNPATIKSVENIVVLTGYAEENSEIPLSSKVNSASAFRLLEVARIFALSPHSNIIITGYGAVPNIMKNLLVSIGITNNKIIVENKSNNTFENAQNVLALIENRPFALVTSAGHMPRSMQVFKKLGMKPIPAPTDYLSRKNYLAINYLPSPIHLKYSDLAIHEYVAIFWYRITNRI